MRILSRLSYPVLGFVLSVCLVSMCFSSAAEAAPARERLVLAFGDSLTAGYGLKSSESFPARLEALLRSEGHKVRVYNAGVSGDTTSGGKARLNQVLAALKRKPDLVIVELGANDMLTGQNPKTTEANLDAISGELKARGIPVVLAGMFDTTSIGFTYFDQFNAIYPRVAKRNGAILYPFFMKDVVTNNALMLKDRVHPNAEGVKIIAKNILPTVRAQLMKQPAPMPKPSVISPAGG